MVNMKFIFMVSFIALFATGAAFAAAGDQSTGVGIAAVSYVDRVVTNVTKKVDGLATVATSGSYNDLSDKPTIPTGALASKNTIANADVANNAEIAQSKIANLTTDLEGKQDKLDPETNIKGAGSVTVTEANGVITVTGATPGTATDTVAGVVKLFDNSGAQTDGTMTQKAITETYATKMQLSEKAPGRFKAVNSAVITDADGNVSTGLITNDMLDTGIAQAKVSGLVTVLGRKEDTAYKLTAADTTTIVNDNNKDILYPSVGRVEAMIPTVNSGTLNIVNGATGNRIGVFNANQSGSIEVTIPEATAESAGLAKLYNGASEASDGAMTAKAVTSQLAQKLDASEYKYGYIPTNSDGEGEALIWVE